MVFSSSAIWKNINIYSLVFSDIILLFSVLHKGLARYKALHKQLRDKMQHGFLPSVISKEGQKV